MEATNDLKETNFGSQLVGERCNQCKQPFTKQDLEEKNWEVWWDACHDFILEPLTQGYQLSTWIRSIEHEYCPSLRKCSNCEKEKPEEEMKYIGWDAERNITDEYFCDDQCYEKWELAREKDD